MRSGVGSGWFKRVRKYNPHEDDVLIFRVAQLFFEGKSATQIAEQINHEMDLQKRLTRESVYPLLAKAQSYGFIRLIPPLARLYWIWRAILR
jgi:hypothetical protein